MRININLNFKVGRLIRYFIFSDLFFVAGWGFIEPILALFIVNSVAGATIATVGLAAAVYWMLKAVIQLPIATYLDNTDGEKDDFYVLIGGLVLAAITAFLFAFIDKIWQLYALQVLHAVAFALYTPAWTGMFARHLDKGRYSFEWTLDSTIVAIASGLSGAAGGFMAQWFGFQITFVAAALLTFVAAAVIFFVPDIVLPRKAGGGQPLILDHRPQNVGH